MAFNPQYIDPNDLNPNIALGINIPFNNPSVFTSTYTTQEAIKNNLINFFLTNPGELPLNPSFGGGLRNFLFEQSNEPTYDSLKNFVESKLEQFFPTVKILNLDVLTENNNPDRMVITLNYSVINTNIGSTINIQI
jgi:phage baseplate assembly protein W